MNMSRKDLTIGLFGFGCVGNGLHEVLQKTPGLRANIKRICVKDRNKKRPPKLEGLVGTEGLEPPTCCL